VNLSVDPVSVVANCVVTVTSTVPLPGGAVAVIEVGPLTVNDVAGVPPNDTAVTPVNPVPVMITLVPPATGPLLGETLVTVGMTK
jgi:hypothetical protein